MPDRTDIISLADQFRIVAGNGRNLKEFCDGFGVDLQAIATPLQIDVAQFNQFDEHISFDRFCRLLEALAAITADDTFGLRYGQYFKPGGTGPFGLGLSHAPTFKDALNFCAKYIRVLVDFEVFSLAIEGNRISISWTFSPLITQREQFMDYSATVIIRHLQNCAGYPFQLQTAQLERRAPTDKSLHSKVFSSQVRFNADINEITLSSDVLQNANPQAEPLLFEFMSKQCDALVEESVSRKDIVTLLKEAFMLGMEDNDRSIEDVAHRLGMSERTLQRRLEDIGTSFWEVYENTRDELSSRLLRDTDLSLSEISYKVGYSSQSAYSRAIKRWHGTSPAQLREQLRNQPGP